MNEDLKRPLNSLPVSPKSNPAKNPFMKDLRNDLAKARDEWLGAEGKLLLDDSILKNPGCLQYLRNRLEEAFIAGWSARPCCFSGKKPPAVKKSRGVK